MSKRGGEVDGGDGKGGKYKVSITHNRDWRSGGSYMPRTMTFLFIDATKTDADTRRQARSHAMKGKNVGKKHLNRRTKKSAAHKSRPSRPRIHDVEDASSSDSSSNLKEDTQLVEDFLLPISPALVYPLRDDFIAPVHLTTNTTPQNQHVIKQCKRTFEENRLWAVWPETYADQSSQKSRIVSILQRSVPRRNMSVVSG